MKIISKKIRINLKEEIIKKIKIIIIIFRPEEKGEEEEERGEEIEEEIREEIEGTIGKDWRRLGKIEEDWGRFWKNQGARKNRGDLCRIEENLRGLGRIRGIREDWGELERIG